MNKKETNKYPTEEEAKKYIEILNTLKGAKIKIKKREKKDD